SLLLAQLVDDGVIDLDAPLADYLPAGTKLPQWEGRDITAFDLATHTSGLPAIPTDLAQRSPENPYSGYDADDLLAWLADYRLTRPIGETFEYSNTGVALLAQAIEHVSGKPYAELVETEILTPLGMDETFLALTGAERPDMATGHDQAGHPVPYWDFEAFAPAGGLVSTAADLTKFIAAASGQDRKSGG